MSKQRIEHAIKKAGISKGGKVGDIKTLTQQTKRRLLLRCQCLTAFPSTTHLQKKTPEGVAGAWGKGSRGIPLQADRETLKRGLYLCLLF